MKDFKTANNSFCQEDYVEKFDESSKHKERPVVSREKSIIIVLKYAQLIIQMLTNSRVMGDGVLGSFARTRKDQSILRNLASSDAFWYMLF